MHVRVGDGYAGWPEHAPYDRIIGAAAAPSTPRRRSSSSSPNDGILVMPIGIDDQELRVLQKHGDRLETALDAARQVRADDQAEL